MARLEIIRFSRTVYALADDGTLWVSESHVRRKWGGWVKIPPLPQETD
jgi:hypothetical protein